MLSLNIQNNYTTIKGDYNSGVIDITKKVCSYKTQNYEWMPKYQSGQWDGTISLFNKRTMQFPTGLYPVVSTAFEEANVTHKIIDERVQPTKHPRMQLNPQVIFRDYQKNAIESIRENTRGILAMCTGSGKTKTSCGIIEELSVYPVIFVVPSIALLLQTAEEFKDSLIPQEDNMEIGIIGGGKCIINPKGVNVATYHTLLNAYDKKYSDTKYTMLDIKDKTNVVALKKQLKNLETDLIHSASKKKVENQIKKVKAQLASISQAAEKKENLRNLMQNCKLIFIDETHIAAEIIEFISLKCVSAHYKCGLTGTPQRMDNQDVRMFGATGPVIFRVTSSDLIKRGFLVRPYIYCIDLSFLPKTEEGHWSNVYKSAIVNNNARNELIRDLALEMNLSGRPTLIMVEHLNHGEQLQEMIEGSVFVPGGDGSDNKDIPKEELDHRRYQLNRLERNEIIMIATSWSFVGVDAPKISCIILACSIGSLNTVTQQVGRGLRIAQDKTDCIIFDFKMPEKNLRQQFSSRMKFYKSEPEFVVKNFKYNASKGFSCLTQ